MSDHEDPAPAAQQDEPPSRSRTPPRKTKKNSGFKWKQKPATAEDDDRREPRDGPGRRSRYDDDRGSASRPSYRGDDDRRDRDRDRDRDYRHPDRRDNRDYRRHRSRSRSPRRDRDHRARDRSRDSHDHRPKKEKKDKAPAAPAAPAAAADGEEMIIVHVNDRLGTKAAIPCFASDDIKSFKVMVAARIGREPHEILLKRQGERPFKDHITLGDYGISNGVQLDLEVDTGD